MKAIKYLIFGTIFLALTTLNFAGNAEELVQSPKDSLKNTNPADVKPTHYDNRVEAFEKMKDQKQKIVFLGSSTTEICDWAVLFQNNEIVNRGISGDTTAGVLNRIQQITDSKPKKLFIMIGRNDLQTIKNVVPAINNYRTIIKTIIKDSPDTKIYIQSLLPNTLKSTNDNILLFNNKLEKLANEYNLPFINIFPLFTNAEGTLDSRYTYDGVHPNSQGYEIWKKAIEKYVITSSSDKQTDINIKDNNSSIGDKLFEDISNQWAKQSILRLSKKEIINGYNDGTFKPNKQLTRAEATVMILKAMNIKPAKDTTIAYDDALVVESLIDVADKLPNQ